MAPTSISSLLPFLLLFLLFSPLISLSSSSSSASNCTVNDPGGTPGECTHIRNCSYQIGRLRIGATVTNCDSWSGGKRDVCCPRGMSISERKCIEWREMLHAPTSFDEPRLAAPLCSSSYGGWDFPRHMDAVHFEYPHSVALGYGPDLDNLELLCGATLISEVFLLTAAHCVTNQTVGKPSYAFLGESAFEPKTTRAKQYRGFRIVAKIAAHFIHPDYKPLIYNDIALLQLSSPLELDRWVLPACVGNPLTTPKSGNGHSKVEAGSWGIKKGSDAASPSPTRYTFQAINVTLVKGDACNQTYGENLEAEADADKRLRYPRGIVRSQLCATEADQDVCRVSRRWSLHQGRKLPVPRRWGDQYPAQRLWSRKSGCVHGRCGLPGLDREYSLGGGKGKYQLQQLINILPSI